MNTQPLDSFTAIVGVDWGDTKHDICIQPSIQKNREFSVIAHNVNTIDQWAQALHARFGGMIAIAVELSKGPIVSALQKYDFIVIFPINPATLATYRKTFVPRMTQQMQNWLWIYCFAILSTLSRYGPRVSIFAHWPPSSNNAGAW